MITSRSTLQSVTGLQRPSAIRRWLDRERIPYLMGADNWPKVSQEILDSRLSGSSAAAAAKKEPVLRDWRRA